MDKKWNLTVRGIENRGDAQRHFAGLGKLAGNPTVKLTETLIVTDLLPIEPERLAELGTVNMLEFGTMLEEVGRPASRVNGITYCLIQGLHSLPEADRTVAYHDEPLYEVDGDAIRAQARQGSRASRKHFEYKAKNAEYDSHTSIDLGKVAARLLDGTIAVGQDYFGPYTVDDLTMVVNLRIAELDQTPAQN